MKERPAPPPPPSQPQQHQPGAAATSAAAASSSFFVTEQGFNEAFAGQEESPTTGEGEGGGRQQTSPSTSAAAATEAGPGEVPHAVPALRVVLPVSSSGQQHSSTSHGGPAAPSAPPQARLTAFPIHALQKHETPDKQHYAHTFPPRTVYILSACEALSACLAIALQIVLLSNADHERASASAINCAPGVWAGLAASLAACMGWMAARRPTRCTMPASLVASGLAGMLGFALVGLATYGLVLVNRDDGGSEGGGGGQPQMLRIHLHPIFSNFVVQPMVDEAKEERARLLMRVQLICFSALLVTGLWQVVSSVMLTTLACRAWRCHPAGSALQHGSAQFGSVLFSTRSEGAQRDGFISIPLPSGLYAVTGDTLEDNRRRRECQGGRRREEPINEIVEARPTCSSGSQQEDPPPKYEDMSFHM